MKKLVSKLLVGGCVIAAFSLTSCKSNGYGCDYSYNQQQIIDQEDTPSENSTTRENQTVFVKYTKE